MHDQKDLNDHQMVTCTSRQWFHLRDNGEQDTINADNIMHTKHTITNDHTDLCLNLSDVSASDAGVYGCVNQELASKLCLHVHGKCLPLSTSIARFKPCIKVFEREYREIHEQIMCTYSYKVFFHLTLSL